MKDWNTITEDEKQAYRNERGKMLPYTVHHSMSEKLERVESLLHGNKKALDMAHKMAWGNYFINTAEDIAAFCLSRSAKQN